MADQWPFADRQSGAWELDGVWHAVVLTNLRFSPSSPSGVTGDAEYTVCGIPTGNGGTATRHAITCQDCLFDDLDWLGTAFDVTPRLVPA